MQPLTEKHAPQASVRSRRQLVSILCETYYCLDGSTYAYSVLNIDAKNFDDLGDELQNYEHLREVYLNKNKFSNIDKLRTLKFLQILEAKDNKIADNFFMSESTQQL